MSLYKYKIFAWAWVYYGLKVNIAFVNNSIMKISAFHFKYTKR